MFIFKIQLLLNDNTWSTRFSFPKIDWYSDSLTQWTLVGLHLHKKNMVLK